MIDIIEMFLGKFEALKKQVGHKPHNVKWTTKNSKEIAVLCEEVNRLHQTIVKRLSEKSEKYAAQVPPKFMPEYRDFIQNYHRNIEAVAEIEKEKQIAFIMENQEAFMKLFEEHQRSAGIDPNAPAEFDDFDVTKDDPVELMDTLFVTIPSVIESIFDDDDFGEELHKALGAWHYLQDTIGVDLEEIFRRRNETPFVFVPTNVSDRHGLTETGSLYDLLRQAHRAYIFGCDGAAMALCRALLEQVLTEHYDVEGEDLEEIITYAEVRYRFMKSMKLQNKRLLANRILHNPKRSGKITGVEVKSFLDVITGLIERAPQR